MATVKVLTVGAKVAYKQLDFGIGTITKIEAGQFLVEWPDRPYQFGSCGWYSYADLILMNA